MLPGESADDEGEELRVWGEDEPCGEGQQGTEVPDTIDLNISVTEKIYLNIIVTDKIALNIDVYWQDCS